MNSNRPIIVIVTGRPAAGKSTLANRLSKDLGIPLVSKDSIREELFNRLGCSTMVDNTSNLTVSQERLKDLKGQ